MLKGKTETGFSYEVSDESLNDYELVEILAEVDTNPLLLPKLVNKLLGKEQKKKLLDHLRTEDGKVPIDAISAEIMDIFQNGKIKNS